MRGTGEQAARARSGVGRVDVPSAGEENRSRVDARLGRRGQKKVSPWFPGRVSPVFAGWYDVRLHVPQSVARRVRLYWASGQWLARPGEGNAEVIASLRRRRFEWRGIDRIYYQAEQR